MNLLTKFERDLLTKITLNRTKFSMHFFKQVKFVL